MSTCESLYGNCVPRHGVHVHDAGFVRVVEVIALPACYRYGDSKSEAERERRIAMKAKTRKSRFPKTVRPASDPLATSQKPTGCQLEGCRIHA